jgi:hypothetical protein
MVFNLKTAKALDLELSPTLSPRRRSDRMKRRSACEINEIAPGNQ